MFDHFVKLALNGLTMSELATITTKSNYYNEIKYKVAQVKKQQSAKTFPPKNKTLKQQDTAAKKFVLLKQTYKRQ